LLYIIGEVSTGPDLHHATAPPAGVLIQ